MNKHGSVFAGALLIAGTTIGGGMLALPVLTGLSGFAPSLLIYVLCWAFMACTGLLFIELCQWMDKDANIITMARLTLGPIGEAFAWLLYIFLFYSLTLAYLVGCGDLLSQLFNDQISEWVGALVFALVATPLLFVGPRAVSPLNLLLMLGLGVTYLTFVVMGAPHVEMKLLTYSNWSMTFFGLPIAFTAFAYQGTVPTVFNFMGRSVQKTRKAVLLGSLVPLVAYIIWQWLILGTVPVFGDNGLYETMQAGGNAVKPLKTFIQSPAVFLVAEFFAFFALVTSFFGVSLGLMDFLADGLSIDRTFAGKSLLCFVLFAPPLIIAFFYPGLFLSALDLAGGVGCALLLGLLPVLMVWSGRYVMNHTAQQVLPGGRLLLVGLIAFVVMELLCELIRGNEIFTI